MTFSPRSFLPAFALLAFVSCKCGDGDLRTLNACEGVTNVEPGNLSPCSSDVSCGEEFVCAQQKNRTDLSCCVATRRKCNTEADCCAGQECGSSKTCTDKATSCSEDKDCGGDGRFCLPWTNLLGQTANRCQYKACSQLGECEPGLSCFQGECVAGLPCGGSCEQGKACLAKTGSCQSYECPASCAPGFIATFKDPSNSWQFCRKAETVCECAELPGLASNDRGRFSALAADPSTGDLWVSEYDGQYGDLVVSRFDSQGKRTKQEYLDGIPANGVAKWGASGPRGGVEEPGDDVGRYTDIAFGGGRAFVSYYDATRGDLKLAKRQADGVWSTLKVDGDTGDLGLYSSVAVDIDGMVGIAYFQKGGSASFNPTSCPGTAPTGDKSLMTALKFAKAKVVNPGPNDFTITTLACSTRTAVACSGCTQVCADPAGTAGTACYAAASGCTACAADDVCVMAGGKPTCASPQSPSTLQEIPRGTGLFPSLAFKGKDAYISYQVRNAVDANLYGVQYSATGVRTGPTLIESVGDLGYFTDLKFKPDATEFWLSFYDFSAGALKVYRGTNFSTGTTAVVDSGTGGPGSGDAAYVGADSSLAFTSAGVPMVVYQDSTRNDLKVAIWRAAGWEKLAPIRADGAVGFFSDAAFVKGTLFVSHAQIRARLVGSNPTVANTLLMDRFTPP